MARILLHVIVQFNWEHLARCGRGYFYIWNESAIHLQRAVECAVILILTLDALAVINHINNLHKLLLELNQ